MTSKITVCRHCEGETSKNIFSRIGWKCSEMSLLHSNVQSRFQALLQSSSNGDSTVGCTSWALYKRFMSRDHVYSILHHFTAWKPTQLWSPHFLYLYIIRASFKICIITEAIQEISHSFVDELILFLKWEDETVKQTNNNCKTEKLNTLKVLGVHMQGSK